MPTPEPTPAVDVTIDPWQLVAKLVVGWVLSFMLMARWVSDQVLTRYGNEMLDTALFIAALATLFDLLFPLFVDAWLARRAQALKGPHE